jgi:hypothetical protein
LLASCAAQKCCCMKCVVASCATASTFQPCMALLALSLQTHSGVLFSCGCAGAHPCLCASAKPSAGEQ